MLDTLVSTFCKWLDSNLKTIMRAETTNIFTFLDKESVIQLSKMPKAT